MTESSETRKKVIELGSQLVAQLNDHEQADTLSRWVAHYIAEQIALTEQTGGQDKAAAEERCLQAIMTLWSHRSSMPNGARPLEDFEPILHALDRLDPANPRPMWHSLGHRPDGKDESTETIDAMDCILSMDRIVRELIETLLHSAVANAVKLETRLYLSEAIPNQAPGSLPTVRAIVKWFDAKQVEQVSLERNLVHKQKQIENLGKFCALAQATQRAMQAEVDALRAEEDASV